MNGEEALNKDGAHEIISALENAVKVIVCQMKYVYWPAKLSDR